MNIFAWNLWLMLKDDFEKMIKLSHVKVSCDMYNPIKTFSAAILPKFSIIE